MAAADKRGRFEDAFKQISSNGGSIGGTSLQKVLDSKGRRKIHADRAASMFDVAIKFVVRPCTASREPPTGALS